MTVRKSTKKLEKSQFGTFSTQIGTLVLAEQPSLQIAGLKLRKWDSSEHIKSEEDIALYLEYNKAAL